MLIFLLILLFFSLLLEGTVTMAPLALIILLVLGIFRKEKVFLIAFVSGLVLDIFTLQPLGSEAIFFLLFLFLVMMYQRKYEINSYPFVIFSSFFGAYLYLLVFGKSSLAQATLSSVFAVLLFSVFKIKNQRSNSKKNISNIKYF